MRSTNARLRTAIVAALAAVACVMAGAIPAEASGTSRPKKQHCTTYDVFEKLTNVQYNDVPPTGPSPEDTGQYWDTYTYHGKFFGTVHGSGQDLYVRPSDGHLIGYYTEDLNLVGGFVRTYGLVDVTAEYVLHEQATLTAVGNSGRFAGLTGTRQWKLDDSGDNSQGNTSLTLCR
jgi:hypothetical protein